MDKQKVDMNNTKLKEIWLAGGCFWGVQAYMARIDGVVEAISGYSNGDTENPTYEDVCYRNTGHAEAVHVKYDSDVINLKTLLSYFFRVIDPTVKNRQGNDVGVQYRTGIYYTEIEDRDVILEFIEEKQKKYDGLIVTEVLPLINFYPAEEYHQNYLGKNPNGYCHINLSLADKNICKEDNTLYDKPHIKELKNRLTKEQYWVTQQNGTEAPFRNEYWDNQEPGIYVDIVTGEPLFMSKDKFDSGCGWPSFTKPLKPEVVKFQEDRTVGMNRTEVRSHIGDSHLGHVFEDGPSERGGRRFCINSASMRFIPKVDMKKEGYGQYMDLLE